MKPLPKMPDQAEAKAALRRAAEARFKGQSATQPPQTEADQDRLLFELSIHQIELEMQNEELRVSHDEIEAGLERYSELFDFAPVGYFDLTADGTIGLVNLAGPNLVGLERARLKGRCFQDWLTEPDRTAFRDFLQRVFATKTRQALDITLLKPDQTQLHAHLEAQLSPDGRSCRLALSDITERKQAEALQVSLTEKTTLLQEVHHRVKNNLQIVSSLLNLQAGQVKDATVLELLSTTRNRVGAMALLHENLYQSENLARLHLPAYVERLCAQLLRAIGPGHTRVRLERQVEPKTVSLTLDQAVPCGLLLNELVTNALKYAFPGDRSGCIRVTLERATPQSARLTVADDGVGLPATLDPRRTSSLGLRLVSLLTEQLHGTVHFERGQGTVVQILFPNSLPTETPHE